MKNRNFIFTIASSLAAAIGSIGSTANTNPKRVIRRGTFDEATKMFRMRTTKWPFNGKNRAQRNRLSAGFQSM